MSEEKSLAIQNSFTHVSSIAQALLPIEKTPDEKKYICGDILRAIAECAKRRRENLTAEPNKDARYPHGGSLKTQL